MGVYLRRIEVYAGFDYAVPSEHVKDDSLVKGHIICLDYDKNKVYSDECFYPDKYSFAMYVMKKYWTNEYRWDSLSIHFGKRVVEMKGERTTD